MDHTSYQKPNVLYGTGAPRRLRWNSAEFPLPVYHRAHAPSNACCEVIPYDYKETFWDNFYDYLPKNLLRVFPPGFLLKTKVPVVAGSHTGDVLIPRGSVLFVTEKRTEFVRESSTEYSDELKRYVHLEYYSRSAVELVYRALYQNQKVWFRLQISSVQGECMSLQKL